MQQDNSSFLTGNELLLLPRFNPNSQSAEQNRSWMYPYLPTHRTAAFYFNNLSTVISHVGDNRWKGEKKWKMSFELIFCSNLSGLYTLMGVFFFTQLYVGVLLLLPPPLTTPFFHSFLHWLCPAGTKGEITGGLPYSWLQLFALPSLWGHDQFPYWVGKHWTHSCYWTSLNCHSWKE